MGYFNTTRDDAARMAARLEHTHHTLSAAWRDNTGRAFIQEPLGEMRRQSTQILDTLHSLEALERRLKALY